MLLSKALLLSSLIGVQGLSVWQPEQEAIGATSTSSCLIITVQPSTQVSRLAELATVDLLLTTAFPTCDDEDQATQAAMNVQSMLELASYGDDALIESWNLTQKRVGKPNHHVQEVFDERKPSSIYTDDDELSQKTTARFSIRFRNVISIASFVDDVKSTSSTLSPATDITVRSINWDVSEPVRAEMMTELRGKIIREARKAGEDYAAAFDMQLVAQPLEIEELYSYSSTRFDDRFYMWEEQDETDLEPKEVKTTLEAKAKFRAVLAV